jgi:hypothetical protein
MYRIHDVQIKGDPISDSILTALYRYLCGYGDGLLTDRALHRVVYGLMTKLFKRLISALKKLGTKIVYADFSRIIIHTDKVRNISKSFMYIFKSFISFMPFG